MAFSAQLALALSELADKREVDKITEAKPSEPEAPTRPESIDAPDALTLESLDLEGPDSCGDWDDCDLDLDLDDVPEAPESHAAPERPEEPDFDLDLDLDMGDCDWCELPDLEDEVEEEECDWCDLQTKECDWCEDDESDDDDEDDDAGKSDRIFLSIFQDHDNDGKIQIPMDFLGSFGDLAECKACQLPDAPKFEDLDD